ncbi:MAG TPA: DUF2442 domain-containing protein [Solirubrobacteraceae bacterium]|jgi:hypothetical protein|nr:DUF2442 domain-containing protein [Solirubrobacteraceae bacterium]
MASSGKKKTTMAKLTRESKLRERRMDKQAKKDARKLAPTAGASTRSTPLLTEAQPLDGYIVHVRFEDGTTADVDLSYLLDYGGMFAPLRDPAYFGQLRADAEAGTIVWPNDADVAPEALYAQAQQHAAAAA